MKKLLLLILIVMLVPVAYAKSGHMTILAVSEIAGMEFGTTADLYLDILPGRGRVFIDTFPLAKLDTQLSTRFAKSIACDFLDKNCNDYDFFYTIRARSSIVGGPSASGAIAVLTAALLDNLNLDKNTVMTGTINSGGMIGPVGGTAAKIMAADKANFTKVLISDFSLDEDLINKTEGLRINIVDVSTLEEAIYQFTGKKYSKKNTITIDASYIEVMEGLAQDLCSRAREFSKRYTENTSSIQTAREYLEKAEELINTKKYYSAASFCFTANIKYHFEEKSGLSKEDISDEIIKTRNMIMDFENEIDKKEVKTLTDLQTFMIVKERITESKNSLNESDLLYNDDIEKSLQSLVFSIERLKSAETWSKFFGTGKKDPIEKESLRQSCVNKLGEAEERLQYVEIYIERSFVEFRKELNLAYMYAQSEDYDLCLFKASKTKANADLILTTIRADRNQTQELIDKKIDIARKIIANNNAFFPIIGYSYYEYAQVLRYDDPGSALVFLEYSIELSNLDLYFKNEKIRIFRYFDFRMLAVFILGIILGIIISLIFTINKRKNRRIRF
jgi:uncharacterized protein